MCTKNILSIALLFALFSNVSFSQEQENVNSKSFSYSNITEGGFFATSPKEYALEVTTIHGFSVNDKHHLGFGFGIGIITNYSIQNSPYFSYYYKASNVYIPMFVNYRYYFSIDRKLTPHFNIALGGVDMQNGNGVYSSIAMGFRVKKFSLSSGLSFMAIKKEYEHWPYYNPISSHLPEKEYISKWEYPFGITIKCGIAF